MLMNGKLEPRARKCIFVGYRVGVKGYRVWCNESKKIITSRDIVYDENSMLVSSVEKPIENVVNDVVIDPIDAQLILMKIKMMMFNKNLLLCPQQGKIRRSWLQGGTLKSLIMLHMLSTLVAKSKGCMN